MRLFVFSAGIALIALGLGKIMYALYLRRREGDDV